MVPRKRNPKSYERIGETSTHAKRPNEQYTHIPTHSRSINTDTNHPVYRVCIYLYAAKPSRMVKTDTRNIVLFLGCIHTHLLRAKNNLTSTHPK